MWSNSERTWSVEEAKLMLDCGAEAVVVGGLNEEGTLDEAYLEAMCRPWALSTWCGTAPLTSARNLRQTLTSC